MDRKWLKTSSGSPIVKNKAAYCVLFPLQRWPKADFVLSSLTCFNFPGKVNTGSASLCLVIPGVLASCSLPMVLCAVCPALRATEHPRGRVPLASPALAGQCGVSLRVWSTSQLVPAGSWQTLSRPWFLLAFCDNFLVSLNMCCHLQTYFSGINLLSVTSIHSYASVMGVSSLVEQAGWSTGLEDIVLMETLLEKILS